MGFHFEDGVKQTVDLPERRIQIDGEWHTTFPATKSQPFCGCCVGPGQESHMIFPTPLDLADRDDSGNANDQKIYLTRKSYSNSGDCGSDLGVSTVSDGSQLREFTAEERSFTHFSYGTYEKLCTTPGLNYYGCVEAFGCEAAINPSTKKAYTKDEWKDITEKQTFCQPKNWNREKATSLGWPGFGLKDGEKKSENGAFQRYERQMSQLAIDSTDGGKTRGDKAITCNSLKSDDMCLGLSCVWHISSEQCTGNLAFRDPDCTRNCNTEGSGGGFSGGR